MACGRAARVIAEIVIENSARFRARVFADASYEGDLMAQAGVSYKVGREGSAEYGESLAGVRDHTPLHQFRVPVSPLSASGALLPEITPRTAEAVGRRRQAGPGVQLPPVHDEERR